MQIFGIQNYNLNKSDIRRDNQYRHSVIRTFNENDYFQKSVQKVHFTGITNSSLIQTVKDFKELPRNRIIHCFYCQIPMFSPEFVKDLIKRGVFDGSIVDFIQELAPYKSYLKPTSSLIFDYFEKIANVAPQTHLSRALQNLNSETIKTLREKQIPVFNAIESAILEIPQETQKLLQPIMAKHKKRLMGIPQKEEFSSKDFAYKIKKISKTVVNNTYSTNLSNYSELINNTTLLTNTNLNKNNVISRTYTNKELQKTTLPVNVKGIQLYLIEQIKKIGTKLGRSDITVPCRQAEEMLLGKPVNIKFSNKTFRHDIDKILKEHVDEKQRKKILKLTDKLPQSENNISSFVAKHEFSNSSTIGYELLKPSIDTLEHMKPESTHMPNVNTLGNYSLACGPCNHKRSSSSMSKTLKKYPITSPQVYFNDIIGVVNDGFISLEDLLRMKETIYNEGSRQMRIQGISNKVLRDNFDGPDGQKNFDKFIELANENLISGRDIYTLQQMLRQRCGIAVKVENLKYLFY